MPGFFMRVRWETIGRVKTIRRIPYTLVLGVAPAATAWAQAAAVAPTSGDLAAGAYFGMIGLLVAASAGHAVAERDRNFAAFAAYLLLLGLAQAVSLGVASRHLWPGEPDWDALAHRISPGTAAAAGLWLVKVVTEPARFSRALNLACWSFLAALLSAVAMHAFVDTAASQALVNHLVAGALLVGAGLIVLAWRKGRDAATGWIAVGFLPGAGMAALSLAQEMGWVGRDVGPGHWGLGVGTAMQMPVLYYALSRRAARRRHTGQRAAELHHTDALTGLQDRGTLVSRLDDALARARNLHHACAVLGVRLSNHEALVEELGREAANRALVVAASILRRAAADIDVAARTGERDFALLIEGPTTGPAALARAQQVVAQGLQEARALPRATTLKFHVAVALLPDHELDARRCLKWMDEACDAMRADPRRAIRAINF